MEYSFDITIDALRVWSISGHYTLSTAGRFFKKCQNFCQKIASGAYFWRQNVAPWWCNENFFSETNSICMDFICLQWLAAGILSVRNNGLLSCYIEFFIRAKTGFSYGSHCLRTYILLFKTTSRWRNNFRKEISEFPKTWIVQKKKHKKRIKRENRILKVVQKYKNIITLDNIQQYLGELVKASKHKL